MLRAIVACGLMALLFVGLGGCGDDPVTPSGDYNRIVLEPIQFPTLKSGLVYQGWVVKIDADTNWLEYQQFGRFFWDEHEYRFLDPADLSHDIGNEFKITGNVYNYDMIAITLEQFPTDPDPAKPSPTIIALCGIDPDRATIMRFHRSFPAAQNMFAIGTYSDGHYLETGQDRVTEQYGLWFIDVLNAAGDTIETYTKGLTLPSLPDTGYLYEGWIFLNSGDTVSTGKFYSPGYIDYDNSHCKDGTIPNYPGEDFLLNRPATVPASRWPLNLLGGGIVEVTLEPNPDNDLSRPSPFTILRGNLPVAATKARGKSSEMGFITDLSLPKVAAKFEKSN
jgi:hypothetical protein